MGVSEDRNATELRKIRTVFDKLTHYARVYNDPELSYATWHMNRRRLEVLLANLQEVNTGRVLDLGCGYGFLFNPLCTMFKTVVGIDISPAMLSVSRKRKAIHLVVADAHYLPFKDEIFDCTIALNVFLHLQRPEKTMTEISRTTKRNGLLLVETMNKFSPQLFFKKVGYLLESSPWTRTAGRLLREPDKRMSIRSYSDRDISLMADRAKLNLLHRTRYLLVANQYPRALAMFALKLERMIEATPILRRLALMSLHAYTKR